LQEEEKLKGRGFEDIGKGAWYGSFCWENTQKGTDKSGRLIRELPKGERGK